MNSATESHLDTQPEPGDASVALLKKFLQSRQLVPNSDSDDPSVVEVSGETEYTKRFKCIPRAVNVSELNLGRTLKGLLTTYNSKPFMTGPKCHRFFHGRNYLEIDADLHKFVYMAKKGIYQFSDMLSDFVFDLAFVIQAEHDEEMPERVLGCVRVSKVDSKQLLTIEQLLEEAKQKHQKSKQQQKQKQQQQRRGEESDADPPAGGGGGGEGSMNSGEASSVDGKEEQKKRKGGEAR